MMVGIITHYLENFQDSLKIGISSRGQWLVSGLGKHAKENRWGLGTSPTHLLELSIFGRSEKSVK